MKDNKRVVQISLDIIIDCEYDGERLAEDVAIELEVKGFKVVGFGFQEDMTEVYKTQYPNFKV